MQAIRVKFLPATNHLPARYKATAEAGSITIPQSFSGKCPEEAALALCQKFGWHGDLIEGGLPDGSSVFVFLGGPLIINPVPKPTR